MNHWHQGHVTTPLVLSATRQASTSVQQPSALLRKSACDTFPKSQIMLLRPATTLLTSIPSNKFITSDEVFCAVATATSNTETRITRTHRRLSRHQGNPNLVVRPSWNKSVRWITLQNPVTLHLVHKKTLTLKCLNQFVQSHDSPIHVEDLENGLLHLLGRSHTIWPCWRRAGDHAGQHCRFPFGPRVQRVVTLIKLAASSLRINFRVGGVALHATDPDDTDFHTPTACLTNGGCSLCDGTLTCTDTSPTPIVDGNFVGGAFYIPFGISSTTYFTLFSLAVSTLPHMLSPLASFLPAHIFPFSSA